MGETKEIILTGDAADSYSNKKRRKSRRNSRSGGGSTQAGTIVQLQSTSSSTETPTAVPDGINPSKLAAFAQPTQSTIPQSTIPQSTIPQSTIPQSTTPTTIGGGKPKIVLGAPKKKMQKVVLSISKRHIQKPIELPNKNKTRKSSKKISFSLKNLRRKLNEAKTIKKHSQEKSFSEIKKVLEEAKLIKKESKAPEAMIRQIYNDYMTMKHKAL